MNEPMQSKRFAIEYQGPANGQPYEMWREGICRSFCRLDAEPSENDRIDCRVDFALVHSLTLATPTGSSARFARTRDLVIDGCDDLVLIQASRGPVHVTQKGQSIDLAAGQGYLIEMNVAASVALNNTGKYTTTRFPRRSLLQVAPNAEAKLSQPLGGNTALMTMIDRYFALCYDVARDLDAAGQQTAAQHLTDLVGLLLRNNADQEELVERGYSHARLELLKSETLKHLCRSNLTIGLIARATGLGTRQAQRIFAESGTTFTECVLAQRLALAHKLLIDPLHRHRKVSDVAYSVGFGDLSYFNRAFRRRFGIAPSDMRAEAGRFH
jgi:AraC-like DNA-binding protein